MLNDPKTSPINSVMTPRDGRGKEISDRLREELGVPAGVISFSVHFEANEAVTVECKYFVPAKAG